mmetsp:Transcript_36199/g.88436  ORF Transcript_36199/g.88436 Transcript_36199/m.88436 type:complete len:215 (+) Transcript_36199:1758-2402(+)
MSKTPNSELYSTTESRKKSLGPRWGFNPRSHLCLLRWVKDGIRAKASHCRRAQESTRFLRVMARGYPDAGAGRPGVSSKSEVTRPGLFQTRGMPCKTEASWAARARTSATIMSGLSEVRARKLLRPTRMLCANGTASSVATESTPRVGSMACFCEAMTLAKASRLTLSATATSFTPRPKATWALLRLLRGTATRTECPRWTISSTRATRPRGSW